MRRPMTLTMLVGLVALAAFATTGAAQPAGPGGGGFGGLRLGMGAPSLTDRAGHLETNPESRALWERLGDLQRRLRDQQWELFELQNAERPSREAIADRSTEIRELNEEMRQMNFAVDDKGKTAREVAYEFLVKKGLVVPREMGKRVTAKDPFLIYFWAQRYHVLKLLKEHLYLTLVALTLAVIVSIPAGIALTRFEKIRGLVFTVINTFQTIPSLALLGFLVPVLGIGRLPAIVALFLYALLPLVRNTYTGIREIDPKIIEASQGIGLTNLQILRKVEMPIALPMIIAGIRTSTVIIVGTATLAALIGAGGLGDPIFRGISSVQMNTILLGAAPAALLAIFLDKLLHFCERRLVSKGLRIGK